MAKTTMDDAKFKAIKDKRRKELKDKKAKGEKMTTHDNEVAEALSEREQKLEKLHATGEALEGCAKTMADMSDVAVATHGADKAKKGWFGRKKKTKNKKAAVIADHSDPLHEAMHEAARQEKTSEKMSEKTPTASEAKNVGGYLDVRPDDAEAKSPDTSFTGMDGEDPTAGLEYRGPTTSSRETDSLLAGGSTKKRCCRCVIL